MHSRLPTRDSAAESDGEGRRRVMRWKKAVFVIWFIWVRNERVGSRIIPRLRTRVKGGTIMPSISWERSWVERGRDLLQFRWRKLCCSHFLKSVRQVVGVQWVAAKMVLVVR